MYREGALPQEGLTAERTYMLAHISVRGLMCPQHTRQLKPLIALLTGVGTHIAVRLEVVLEVLRPLEYLAARGAHVVVGRGVVVEHVGADRAAVRIRVA